MKNEPLKIPERVLKLLPSEERRKKGPYAIFECFQQIPCNPCYTACRFGAVKELTDAALRGEYARALRLQREQQPLIEALFASVSPIPVKAALALSGLDCGSCRLPLSSPEPDLTERLRELI